MATNIEHFNEHTDSFIVKTKTKNIFSLISRKAVEEFFSLVTQFLLKPL